MARVWLVVKVVKMAAEGLGIFSIKIPFLRLLFGQILLQLLLGQLQRNGQTKIQILFLSGKLKQLTKNLLTLLLTTT